MPNELDFFKYAQGGKGKRKTDTSLLLPKKRKIDSDNEHSEKETQEQDSLPAPKHRVTAKGTDVPESLDTFEAMARRYSLPSLVMSNLTKYGYAHPTAIQSHGIPILMEVRGTVSLDFWPDSTL